MMKQTITNALQKALESMELGDIVAQITVPTDPKHGDYTSNVAMIAFTRGKEQAESVKNQGTLSDTLPFTLHASPLQLAESIKAILFGMNIEGIEEISVVRPGFLNFHLSEAQLIKETTSLLNKRDKKTSNPSFSKASEGKKIMVEFTDPNPFKEFHIGHLYSNIVGESLSRLLEAKDNDVWRVTYQGDVGLHVAKSLWGMRVKMQEGSLRITDLEEMTLKERVKFLGDAYAYGSMRYEEDEAAKEEIHTINKAVYELVSSRALRGDLGDEIASPALPAGRSPSASRNDIHDIGELYIKGRRWTLDHFDTIYERLGSAFKKNYFESVTGPAGLALVKKHMEDGVFKESAGAVIFEGEKYGLHNRVFINSLGLPTYEAKDMALPALKYQDYQYDTSIIITADEQSGYFKVVLKALSLTSPQLAAKTRHIAHGMVDVKDEKGNRVKMSSRKGNIITGEWLLNEAKKHIHAAYPQMDEDALEKVAVASVKYALLKSGIGKNTEFSFKESISLEGNSGPYLQYTYVRTQSILRKAYTGHPELVSGSQNHGDNIEMLKQVQHDKLNDEEKMLLRTLIHFPEVVDKAAEELAPSHIATYLFDLAQKFNNFYQKHTIVGSEQEEFRLGLTSKVGEVLKEGLHLLGIQVPEKM